MAEITWSPSLTVGVTELDQEHRCLVDSINELRRAMAKGEGRRVLRPVLTRLVDFAAVHHAHEEHLMREHGYPRFDAHRTEHVLFASRVAQLQQRFMSGEPAVALAVHEFASDWIRRHLLAADRDCAAFLNRQGIA